MFFYSIKNVRPKIFSHEMVDGKAPMFSFSTCSFCSAFFPNVLSFPQLTLTFLQCKSCNYSFRKAFTPMLSFLFLPLKLTQLNSSPLTSRRQWALSSVSFPPVPHVHQSYSFSSMRVVTLFPCSNPRELPISYKRKLSTNVFWPQLPFLPWYVPSH